MSDIEVTHNDDLQRYEVRMDGQLAGYLTTRTEGDVIAFTHTVVEEQYGGCGLGSALVRSALDDVRARGGLRVHPACSFVESYVQRHPDYADLTV